MTDDFVKRQVVSDPHSPRQFRVNGVVRNIDAWYAAFDVKPGDKLYVAPAGSRAHLVKKEAAPVLSPGPRA